MMMMMRMMVMMMMTMLTSLCRPICGKEGDFMTSIRMITRRKKMRIKTML